MEKFNLNWSLLLDPLSLFFLFVIVLISLPAAVYSVGYMKHFGSQTKKVWVWLLFVVFFASMAAVVTAGNIFFFLVVWEVMSLASYGLVVLDGRHEKSVQAGFIYIVMTHIGTAFLIAAFLILYQHAHSFDFAVIRETCRIMPSHVKDLVFILLLIGFGTKAGIVPLHIWLPYAHPQAPSHISSLMSGVMIKTAIYGMIRFVVYGLGVDAEWWGIMLIILAALSCLVGVIYALIERDIKRLLAYSSVENVGIILLGIGACMIFIKLGMTYLAVFSLAAALYHLINHAIFKGLLFLCAGSVYQATGTRDMEKMGGLIRSMPWTSACFLLGALAISAIPPFNGFVSEWLTLQMFFLGAFHVASSGMKLFFGLSAAVLALTGGLAAACFVKAFGIIFLALPRSRYAADAKEDSNSMKYGMGFLGVLTLGFGLAAGWIIKVLANVSGSVLQIDTRPMRFALNHFILIPQPGRALYFSPLFLGFLTIVFALAAWGLYRLTGKRQVSTGKTWDCGYYRTGSRNEYTSTAFSKPFGIAFSFFLRPYRKIQKIHESFYLIRLYKYETHTTPVFKKYIYEPVIAIVMRSARLMRKIQPGSIHLYLAYIFITVIMLVLFKEKF